MTSHFRIPELHYPLQCMVSLLTAGVMLLIVPRLDAEDFALVVGINHCDKFQLPDGSRPRPLRAAESDADAVAAFLQTELGFRKERIRLLKGDQATRSAVATAFRELAKELKPVDHLVIHFAGHGTQVPDQKPFDEVDELDEALCLADSEHDVATLLLDDTLGLWLEELPAKHIIVLLDCCHSGTGLKDINDDVQSRFLLFDVPKVPSRAAASNSEWREVGGDEKSLDRDVCALFACHPEQQAYERRMVVGDTAIRAGQFTHFLIEGLRTQAADSDNDGMISRKELTAYIGRHLDETFNHGRRLPSEQQQPLLDSGHPERPVFSRRESQSGD